MHYTFPTMSFCLFISMDLIFGLELSAEKKRADELVQQMITEVRTGERLVSIK